MYTKHYLFSHKETANPTNCTEHSHKNEVEYYNLPPVTFPISNVNEHTNDGKRTNNIHSTHLPQHATLTPPPSPPTSDDTQNTEQKPNCNGQQSRRVCASSAEG